MTVFTADLDVSLTGTEAVDSLLTFTPADLLPLGLTGITSISVQLTVTSDPAPGDFSAWLVSVNAPGGPVFGATFDVTPGGLPTFDQDGGIYVGLEAGPTIIGVTEADGTITVTCTPPDPTTLIGEVDTSFSVSMITVTGMGAPTGSGVGLVGTLSITYTGGAVPAAPLPVEVQVYEEDNTTLVCSLTHDDEDPTSVRQVRKLSGRVSLEDEGEGGVEVDFDHPKVDELRDRRFVRVIEDDETVFSFRIKGARQVLRSGDGNVSGRTIRAAGGGPLEILKKGRVRPWLPYGAKPTTRRRKFDWSSPQLDTSDWTPAVQHFRLSSKPGKPFSIPSLFRTRWIAAEEEAELMTVGKWCVRRQFTIPEPTQVSVFVSADDTFLDCVEGVEIQEVAPPFPALVWPKGHRTPVKLEDETRSYVYAAMIENRLGPTAFIADAWSTGPGGLIDQLFMSGVPDGEDPEYDFLYGEGDEAWLCFLNPAGEWFTVGEILRILLDECHANGELLDVTLGCTDTHDSAGNLWPKIEFECDATGTLYDAVTLLRALHADIAMSDEGLEIGAWVKDGRGATDVFALTYDGKHMKADALETDFEIENDVLLVHDKGQFWYESPLSVLAYGRHPGASIPVGSIDDPVVLEQIAIAHLMPRTTPSTSRPIEVSHLAEFTAKPGDWGTVEGDALRVSEVGYDLGPDGRLRKKPTVDTERQQRVKRADRMRDLWIAQNGDSRVSARVLDTGTGLEPGPIEPVPVNDWSWRDSEELDPEYWDEAEEEPRPWQPYTMQEAARLVGLRVECSWAEPDGFGGLEQVTTGQSRFQLLRDGLPTEIPFIATVPEMNLDDPTSAEVGAIQFILGEGLVLTNQKLSVACIENGGHVVGTVTILGVDPS